MDEEGVGGGERLLGEGAELAQVAVKVAQGGVLLSSLGLEGLLDDLGPICSASFL